MTYAAGAFDQMIAARTTLVLDHPFFGALALRLKLREDPGCGTAWTDGTSIGFDPAFITGLTHDERVGLVAHEVMHCANGHMFRRDGRDPLQWNIACDYAINFILEESHFRLPKDRLRATEYDGMSAEWIHARLPQPPPQAGKGGSPGAGAADVRDAPGTPAPGHSETDWQQAVVQAAQAAKMRGHLPAGLERFAAAAATPRVNWRSVLRRFMQAVAHADYSWARPNPRYLPGNLYLPALRSEAMGPVAFGVDTSGSIDDVTMGQFFAEIKAVASEFQPERIDIFYCDAAVQRHEAFDAGAPVVMNPKGGGGTAFGPVLDAADELQPPPVCLIYLTDLAGSHRDTPPAYPILWATTCPESVPPYGETVSLADV